MRFYIASLKIYIYKFSLVAERNLVLGGMGEFPVHQRRNSTVANTYRKNFNIPHNFVL